MVLLVQIVLSFCAWICVASGYLKSYPNLALGMPTWQSSTYEDGYPSRAVDGYSDGNVTNKHCSHTQYDMHPWWAVDLQKITHINEVVIANREPTKPFREYQRLSNIRIGFTDIYPKNITQSINHINICARQDKYLGPGEIHAFPCSATGRYVVIILEKNEYLTLCEVEVYGSISDTKNWALRKPTKQSSTICGNNCAGNAGSAVDGNFEVKFSSGSCMHTRKEDTPWWTVNLQLIIHIEQVVITNLLQTNDQSTSLLSMIRIGSTNDEPTSPTISNIYMCVRHDKQLCSGETRFFPCEATGRWVVIILEKRDFLSLCEVQVHGSIAAKNFALGMQNVIQSSPDTVHPLAYASRAVDGNSDSDFALGNSCTLTGLEHHPWWAVNLEKEIHIVEVVITNRKDPSWSVNLALNKPAFQKNVAHSGTADRAVDGNKDTAYYLASCTHTELSADPWWAVDLRENYDIASVKLTNRKYISVAERLIDFQIGMSSVNPTVKAPVIGGYTVCASQEEAMHSSEEKNFMCKASGQYVIVQLKGDGILTLCEVEVYGFVYETSVKGRLSNILIGFTKSFQNSLGNISICGVHDETLDSGQTLAIPCPAIAQYIVIMLEKHDNLSLCEVKVHGKNPGRYSYAQRKPACQSSTHEMKFASLAVDGNSYSNDARGKSCSLTSNQRNPWWAVDLQEVVHIAEVAVTTREFEGDQLSKIRIGTTDTDPSYKSPTINNINVCAFEDKALKPSKTHVFPCKASARFVVIILEKKEMLSLCEVKVYGPVDECLSMPCQNGGNCKDGDDQYTCNCTGTGFVGPNCDMSVEATTKNFTEKQQGQESEDPAVTTTGWILGFLGVGLMIGIITLVLCREYPEKRPKMCRKIRPDEEELIENAAENATVDPKYGTQITPATTAKNITTENTIKPNGDITVECLSQIGPAKTQENSITPVKVE